MNALFALDSGFTGKGVTVGVIDDGVVNVNGELDGRISDLSKDFGYVTKNGVTTKRNVLGDEHSDHGTPVANILGAAANGSGTVGFAPDVMIAALRVSDWDEDTKTEELWHTDEAIEYAASVRLKVLSVSLSGGGPRWRAALTTFGGTGGLMVNSAGNSGGADPSDAPWITEANRNAILFVGSFSPAILTAQSGMESYSNRAGTMKDRYVVAIGSNVTARVDGTIGVFSGTSSAAPVVSGLVADIVSKWPQLTGQQAGSVILSTAKDLGEPGPDEVFGMGLVDFKAALAPIAPKLSNGISQTSLQTSVMAIPAAMGAGSIQTALSNVTVLDDYGRDYSGSIADMVIRPDQKQGHWLRRRMAQMGAAGHSEIAMAGFAGSFGFATYRTGPDRGDVRSTMTAGSMSYVSDDYGVHAGWNAQDSLQSDIMGLAPFADGILSYAPQAGNSVGIDHYAAGGKVGLTFSTGSDGRSSASAATLGWSRKGTALRVSYIDETGSVMGMPTGDGALRLGRGAGSTMVEAHQTFDLIAGWSIEGYGSMGFTRLKIDAASVVTGSSTIVGSRVGLQPSGPAFGGVVSLGVAQPLTVESGAARLTYGNGYQLSSRSLTYATTDASLAGARLLKLTAGYAKAYPQSAVRVGVMQDVSDGSVSALAGWSGRF